MIRPWFPTRISARRLSAAAGVVLLLSAMAGCQAKTAEPLPGPQRLIVPEPDELFHPADAFAGESATPEELAAAVGRPWKVDLRQEVRSALLAPPGLAIERTLDAGGPRTLTFAYGVQPGAGAGAAAAVEFQVLLESSAGRSLLFQDEVVPRGPGRGWHRGTLDLAASGADATLVFLTRGAEPFDPARGFPVWGSVELRRAAGSERPPNVVLISVDTLRADHMSLYGYERPTTPRLDAWARSSAVVFESAVAPSPWTLPSHASLFTGLDPLSHDVNYEESVGGRFELFPERLQAAGYTTVAVTGGGYLHPRYGFLQGFDVYRYWASPEGEIEDGTARLVELVRSLPRPFFLFFHTYEAHTPYRPRPPFFERFLESHDEDLAPRPVYEHSFDLDAATHYKKHKWFAWTAPGEGEADLVERGELPEVVARYDSGIAYVDQHLGRLFDLLESTPELRGETAVILTSDHGEALGDKGLGSHASLYDFNLLVPLVVGLPNGARAGERIRRQVRLVDLAPTVLELAGLAESAEADGASLMPLLRGQDRGGPREAWSYAASSSYGISLRLAGRLKYIYTDTPFPPPEEREELYDLARDPAESNDVAGGFADRAALRRKVRDRLDAKAQGLGITISNRGVGTLSGRLRSRAFRIPTIKTWDTSRDSVTWEPRTLTYRLPAGDSLQLLIMDVARSEKILLDGAFSLNAGGAAVRFEKDLSVGDFRNDWRLVLTEGGWREAFDAAEAQGGEPETALVLRWRMASTDAGGAAVEISEELLEQLRALGYLDR